MSTKRIDRLVATLRANGAKVVPHGQRYRVTQPGKELVFLPTADPKEWRALDNKITALRRGGYDV
ncbi:hypothetical protein SUDANB1_05640 [Streptomyces sp. enrichment culture]|uniref:hypothetical protein n=1 Tax=Streptomyces sp. enrichment culture TaxID=1795815 RepID=UPI003F548329